MSKTYKIFCADNLPFLDEVKHLFENVQIDCWPEPTTITDDGYRDAFNKYEGVITTHTVKIDSRLFGDSFKVKALSSYGTGQDYMDKPFLASKGIKTIAFPNISTGVYHFPKQQAAEIAVKTVKDFLQQNKEIEQAIFICYDDENLSIYKRLIN